MIFILPKLADFAKKHGRAVLLVLSGCAVLGSLSLVLFSPLRDALIKYGGFLAGKQLQTEFWSAKILRLGMENSILFSLTVILNVFFRHISRLAGKICGNEKFLRFAVPAFAALSVFNALNFLNLPVPGTGLDPSWVWAVNGVARLDNFVFGRDAVFTYGPLGFIFVPAGYPLHIALAFLANALCITLAGISIKNQFKKLEARRRFVFMLPLFVFVSLAGFEWLWNLTVFVLALDCLQNGRKKEVYAGLAVFALFCAVSLVIKFNTAVFAGCTAFILGLLFLFTGIKKTLVYAAVFAAVYCAVTMLNIVIFFKNVHNFLVWFKMSLEVAGGYSSAMSVKGLPILTLSAAAAVTVYFVFVFKTYKQNHGLCMRLLIGTPVVFFSFKHGFVRQDGHMAAFFTALPLLLTLVAMREEHINTKLRSFLGGVCALFLLFIASGTVLRGGTIGVIKGYARNLYYAIKLPYSFARFEERKSVSLENDVLDAGWNETVAGSSIQILPWELSCAAANNWTGGGGEWRPNPVLQLYSVYTKALDDYSAASFSQSRAPEFILQEFGAIDGRNMFLDTPAVWNAVMPNYHIVKSDSSRLLLERNDGYRMPAFEHTGTEMRTWNEPIPISGHDKNVYAKISIEPSVFGRFVTFVFRGDQPTITLKTKSGNTFVYRIITDTLQTPVLISRVPNDFTQMRSLFEGAAGNDFTVTEITFKTSRPFMHKKAITVEWFRLY